MSAGADKALILITVGFDKHPAKSLLKKRWEFSRAVSTPIPMRQVDGVGRLVPRDLVARPAGVSGCHPRTRTGSARFRAQVTELVPPVPKTKAIIAWWRGVGISLLILFAKAHFPSPPGEGQGEG